MFKKIVAIEPVSMVDQAVSKLSNYSDEVIMYDTLPQSDSEIVARISDADAVLVSYTTKISKDVMDQCPNIRYIGMCCSLYNPESANVDIRAAHEQGIVVYGIRDYGDEGVVEYVLRELITYLHGYDGKMWKDLPYEIQGLNVGIVGLGTTGIAIANALQFLGANIRYYSRTRKPEYEAKGFQYQSFEEVLQASDVVFSCLNKNVILFDEQAFDLMGNHRMFFNTSIGPSFTHEGLEKWLNQTGNEFFCDSKEALGDSYDKLIHYPNVNCQNRSSGRTKQAFDRLSDKVIENIEKFIQEQQ